MPKGASKAWSFINVASFRVPTIGKHLPRVVIKRMPEPPCPFFGPNETPHFIELGGASRFSTRSVRNCCFISGPLFCSFIVVPMSISPHALSEGHHDPQHSCPSFGLEE